MYLINNNDECFVASTGLIVGCIIGVLALILLVVVIILICRR